MNVTFWPCNLLLEVEVASAVVHDVLHLGQVLPQIRMVLVREQAGAIAGLDIAAQHLHLLSGHLQGT